MGNSAEESIENKIPVRFSCRDDNNLENRVFYFDPDITVSEMINKFNKQTKFERKHRSIIYGAYYLYVYKGFPLKSNSQEILRNVFREDNDIKIIINIDYGCYIF